MDVLVGDALDVPVLDYVRGICTLLVPDLKGLASDGVEDRKKTRLVSIFEHL